MADTWDIVGALASTGGTLAAAFAIWQSGAQAKAQSLREEANALRQDIKTYKASADRLLPSLRSGETLLSMAEAIGRGFQNQFAVADVARLNAAMDAVGERISLLVRWLSEDAAATAFTAERRQYQAADSSIGARLPVYSEVTAMVNGMIDDAMSPVFFHRFFGAGDIRRAFLHDIDASSYPLDTEGLIAGRISANAAMYFQARYVQALGAIETFVDQLTKAHLNLSDADLRALSTRAKSLPATVTHTGAMHAYLRAAKPLLGKAATDKLAALVDQIETAVSKEAAGKAIARG